MLVSKVTRHLVEIGPLDNVLRLQTGIRIKHGIKTICHRCRKPVTDETFIAGFKDGVPNMLFHESCLDAQATALLAKVDKDNEQNRRGVSGDKKTEAGMGGGETGQSS